jgi:hypothetical protein
MPDGRFIRQSYQPSRYTLQLITKLVDLGVPTLLREQSRRFRQICRALPIALLFGVCSSVAHGAGELRCYPLTEAELNSVRFDFEDYANGKLPIETIIDRHKASKVNMKLLLYMVWIEKENDREEVDKLVGSSTEESFDDIINYVLYRFAWENDQNYKDAFGQFVKKAQVRCLNPEDNALLIVARYALGDSIDIVDTAQRRLRYLRAGATVSAEFLRKYVNALGVADAALFEIERSFWSERAGLCPSSNSRDECIDQILSYVIKNASAWREEGARQLVCNVAIVEEAEVFTANICM